MKKKQKINILRFFVAVFFILETIFPVFNIHKLEADAACGGLCLFMEIKDGNAQQGEKIIKSMESHSNIYIIDDSPDPVSATLTIRSGMYDSPRIYIYGTTEQIDLIPTTEEIQISVTIVPELKNGHYSAVISAGTEEWNEGPRFYFLDEETANAINNIYEEEYSLSISLASDNGYIPRKYDRANDIFYYELENITDLYTGGSSGSVMLCMHHDCNFEDDGHTYTLNLQDNNVELEYFNGSGYNSDSKVYLNPTLENEFLASLGYYSVAFSVTRDDGVNIPVSWAPITSALNYSSTNNTLAFKLKNSTPDPDDPTTPTCGENQELGDDNECHNITPTDPTDPSDPDDPTTPTCGENQELGDDNECHNITPTDPTDPSDPDDQEYLDKNTINLKSIHLYDENDQEIIEENGIYFVNELGPFKTQFDYDCGEENLNCWSDSSRVMVEPDEWDDTIYGGNEYYFSFWKNNLTTIDYEAGFADFSQIIDLKYKTFAYNQETGSWDNLLSSEVINSKTFTVRVPIDSLYLDKNTININSIKLFRGDEELSEQDGTYYIDDVTDWNDFRAVFDFDCGDENPYCDNYNYGSLVIVEPNSYNDGIYWDQEEHIGFNASEMELDYVTGKASYSNTVDLKLKKMAYNPESNEWDTIIDSETIASKTFIIKTTIDALLNSGISMEKFECVSVIEDGNHLEKKYDAENDLYYFETEKSRGNIQAEIKANFLREGHVYTLNPGYQQFQFGDNGTTKTIDVRPYFNSNNQYSALGYETIDGLSIYMDDYAQWFYLNEPILIKPKKIASEGIEVLSVQQNGAELIRSGDSYKIPDYTMPISVTYKLTNLEIGKQYYSYLWSDSYRSNDQDKFIAESSEIIMTKQIQFGGIEKENWVNIDLNKEYNYTEEEYYSDSLSFKTEITDPNFIELGKIIIDSVSQNGRQITPIKQGDEWNPSYLFELNDIEDYEIVFHTDQAMDDKNYEICLDIGSDWNIPDIVAQGSELKSGITIAKNAIYNSGDEANWLYISAKLEDDENYTQSLQYQYQDARIIHFKFIEDENLPRFDLGLSYANYPDQEIEWGVSPKYHDENNPITLNISGQHFDNNEYYDTQIKVRRGEETIYTNNLVLSGRELNEEKSITLENFLMQLPQSFEEIFNYEDGIDGVGYYFDVNIAGNEHSTKAFYVYEGFVKSATIHENGEFNAEAGGGGGGNPYIRIQGMTLSSSVFEQNKSISVFYITEDYDEDKVYNYELYYGDGDENVRTTEDTIKTGDILSKGVLTGEELNNGVLRLAIKNEHNYQKPAYVLVLKEGEGIIDIVTSVYVLWDGAGILSVQPNGNKDLYLGMGEGHYIAPKESDIDIKVTGVNFEDDKQYIVSASINGTKADSWSQCFEENIIKSNQYSGKELNSGVNAVQIRNSEISVCNSISVNIKVKDLDNNSYIGTYFYVELKDINQYFENEKGISVNNATSRIKSKETTLESLIGNNVVRDDGELIIYKDGERYGGGRVATGMTAQILDKFGRAIVDLDMVVQGDANGDGIMGIIDYIKIKKDIMDTEKFTDGSVFFEAADMNENNKIDILDYIKIRKAIMEEE